VEQHKNDLEIITKFKFAHLFFNFFCPVVKLVFLWAV